MADFPKIKRCELDIDSINEFGSEAEFITISIDLLIEAGSYVSLVGNMLPGETKVWNTNQALLGGHLVRLYKLISAMLDQTCQHRRETSFMFARMAFECIINLSFLLKNYSPELLVSYKSFSLKHEKKLMNRINKKISQRNGEILPIEKRMLKSIAWTFRASGIKPEDIKSKDLRNWGNKNTYEKAEDVGLGDAYLGAFSGPSHNIHGSWQDLLEYHLEMNGEDDFVPDFDWHNPRPQYLNAVALSSVEVLKSYIKWLGIEEIKGMTDTLSELQTRILRLDWAHEKWLSQDA